jgi:hypothetical protein
MVDLPRHLRSREISKPSPSNMESMEVTSILDGSESGGGDGVSSMSKIFELSNRKADVIGCYWPTENETKSTLRN